MTQADYARARAVVDLRIAELKAALDDHEADRANWARADALEQIDRALVEALARLRPQGARLRRV